MNRTSPKHHTAEQGTAAPSSDRAFLEPTEPLRSPFALDRHRIIQSTAFRRLEGKTQAFAASYGDHFRTRLTHTIEVSQLARLLAVQLGANEELAEAIALAHDLGHPPFGHAGESALDHVMSDVGGFNHNTHALRVVEYLEHPFPAFRGLNLTSATRAGLAAHATRYDRPAEQPGHGGSVAEGPGVLPSLEARLVSLADRIAFNAHDLEDAIGAGLLGLDDLSQLELWAASLARTGHQPVGSIHTIRREVLDGLVDSVVADAVIQHRDSASGATMLSAAMDAKLAGVEDFLAERVYGAPEIKTTDAWAARRVERLFGRLIADGSAMPKRFRDRIPQQGAMRVVGDYIAGMTDRFCEQACREVRGRG